MDAEEIAQSVRHIAIAGNPNCGKSTIFNALTGLRQRVGNYSGVTVEHKVGRFFGSHGEPMSLVDLPGHYSLQVRSPDEAVARDVLLGRRAEEPRPDTVVAVVDASNLERNLYLLAQVLDLGLPTVVALNMVDMAEQHGIHIDIPALAEELGVPVIPIVATRGTGLVELRQTLSRPLAVPSKRPPMPEVIEREAHHLAAQLRVPSDVAFPESLLLLTLSDQALDDLAEHKPATVEAVLAAQQRLRDEGLDPLCALVEARYQWIDRICNRVMRRVDTGLSFSDRLDRVLTHRVWGLVVFLAAMALMFFCIFSLAQAPMRWIDEAAHWASQWVVAHLPASNLRDLLAEGAIPGVSGVTVFLPQILILYFFLGMLEDSGYMARAAFMMDRIMSAVGLHGKSFIPLLSSFGCAVPGIMAARTVENRKDRLVTILIAPLMTCPARLPVYTLMIAVLLPTASALTKAGILLSLYLGAIVVAGALAWVFKQTLLKTEKSMLLLELPPYRMPSLRSTALRMMERAWMFLKRAGTVILALSILLWALVSFPKPPAEANLTKADAIAQSYAGHLGHALEPVIAPLGYDWKIGIGLVSSFAAREVFVGTMAIVYNVEGDEEHTLRETMSAERRSDGTPVYTPLVCVSLLVFYMLAMQCISTIVVVRRETNSWRWPLLQLTLLTSLAWISAFAVFHGGHWLGFQ
jgi:ferrous iron transport protein B